MDRNSIFFDIYLLLAGIGCGIFITLGILKYLSILPALLGLVLCLSGFLAVYCDKNYCCQSLIDEEVTIHKNSIEKRGFAQIMITLLEELPLKSFSPGQTLLFIVAMLIYGFILAVIALQGIYNQIEIFKPTDLRLAFLVVSSIILGYALLYAIGELLGIKLLNRHKRKG